MMESDMHVIWGDGQEWVVKREHNHYLYRAEGDYGPWARGIPPEICQRDLDVMFGLPCT